MPTAEPAIQPVPRPRSPAQIEASRRNGARSKGPVTAEGKARASRNALKHGLAALHHLVLEDEAPSELEDLTARLLDELGAATELEARLVRRMAIALWKGERAERLEVALFDAAPRLRPPTVGGTWEKVDPLATFDIRRFNAIRGYQTQQGRELSRCLKELRALRRDPLADDPDEPEPLQNEPDGPAAPTPNPANDDAAAPFAAATDSVRKVQNEPEASAPEPDGWAGTGLAPATCAALDRLLAADDWPGLARLAATGALRPLGLGPADLTSPEALGRALSTTMAAAARSGLAAAGSADRPSSVTGTTAPGEGAHRIVRHQG
jgi:hypothetical protein